MKLIALLSWFDEPPDYLHRAITTAANAGASFVVALDGAYELMPDAQPRSSEDEYAAILSAVSGVGLRGSYGLDCVIRQPSRLWASEMEKRTALFALGHAFADLDDWLLVLDADYELHGHGTELLARLQATDRDVAEAMLETPKGPNGIATWGPPERMPMRCLFRAHPGPIVVDGNHYTYRRPDGIVLWGNPVMDELAPAENLTTALRIRHLTYHRPRERVRRQFDYYRARDASGIERGECRRCRKQLAAVLIPWDLRDRNEDEVDGLWMPVCTRCEPRARERAYRDAVMAGIDPAVARKVVAARQTLFKADTA